MSATDKLGKQFYTLLPNTSGDNWREYAVGTRKGQSFAATHGRVMGSPSGEWSALGVGADSWTGWHKSRTAAVSEMFTKRATR